MLSLESYNKLKATNKGIKTNENIQKNKRKNL